MSKPKKGSQKGPEKPISSKRRNKRIAFPFHHAVAILLIAGVALAAYSNTFSVPFLFDDKPNILENPDVQIKVFTWNRVETLIENTYQKTIRVFSYFTLALNYYFGEFKVFGYHLVNFIVHVVSGIFLYWFLMLTFNLPQLKEKYGGISYRVALLGSLIFIAHPIQTQSVTYIVQRMASMAGMFYLLSMILYVQGRLSSGKIRTIYFGGMVLAYLLGVFSKENVAILPLFVALYEFYFFQNLDLGPRGKKVLFLLGSVLFGLVAFGFILWGKRYINLTIEGYQYYTFTLSERVLTQFRVVLYYLTLLIYPHPSRLNLDYDFQISKTIFDPPTTILSIFIIAGLIGYSFWVAKKRPVLSFFILWYFGNLVIESSVFPLEMVYEHRLYLPSVGPFVLFGLLLIRGIGEFKRRINPVGKVKPHLIEIIFWFVLIGILSLATYSRNQLWKSEVDLMLDCVKKSPQKARPNMNVGYAYIKLGIYDKALEFTQKAIHLDPNYAKAYYNLSILYQKMGDFNQAIDMGKKSLEIDPGLHMAYYSLGGIYLESGQYDKSIEAYRKFLEVYPTFPNVHHLLGVAYLVQKQFDKALEAFESELKVNPYHALAHVNLGQIYWYEFQNRSKAIYHLKMALMLERSFPKRREIMGLVRLLEGGGQ